MYYAHILKANGSNEAQVQTCTEHSRATAALTAERLAGQGLFNSGYIAGLLHDCGKFTAEFSDYLQKAINGVPVQKGSVIHTFAGVSYLLNRFHSNISLSKNCLPAEILAASIGSHHGMFDLWDPNKRNGFDYRLSRQPEYDARAIDAFLGECADIDEINSLYAKAQQEIIEFFDKRIVPWIKNENEGYFSLGLLVRLITSALVDADRSDTAAFMQGIRYAEPESFSWEKCLESIEEYLKKFDRITPIQKARAAFSDICAANAAQPTGLFRLDLPTGGGKTLAALRFAAAHAGCNNMRRIFYVSPLLSILEQNADVIRSAVNTSVPVLEHHSNIVHETMSQEELQRSELLHDSWNAPMIITTFVQLLETLFSGNMSSVRRFNSLCSSVIIIDEVQSLPTRMLTLFNCAINFLTNCCGATVILCSATQPAFSMADHPMMEPRRLISEKTYLEYAPLFKRTYMRDAGLMPLTDVMALSLEILEDSDSLLIVCNTKKEAAGLYQLLKDETDIKCFHLSAGMCIAHRRDMLAELTEALDTKSKLICVSTQVIEAGIDISFGAVIRFSAGLDNIVQAAGRCNRNGEHDEPCPVYICRIADEKLGSLREIKAAQNALNSLLAEYECLPGQYDNDLASDKAVRDYYTFLYRSMARGAQDYPAYRQSIFDMLSKNEQFIPDLAAGYFLNQAFRTAGELFEVFDTAGATVIVPYCRGRDIIDKLSEDRARYDLAYAAALLEQAKPFAVSLPLEKVEQMKGAGAIYTLLDGTVLILNEGYYDNETGIKEGNDLCSTLIL